MQSHAEIYGAEIINDEVLEISKSDGAFRVTTANGTTTARTVIMASGVINHGPPLSKQDHDLGLSRGLIRYCPICDAYEVRGKRIGVLGHGRHERHERASSMLLGMAALPTALAYIS